MTTVEGRAASRGNTAERLAEARALQGEPAGIVSRVVADLIDFVVAAVAYVALVVVVVLARALLSDARFDPARVTSWVTALGFPLLFAAYLAWTWATTGSSVGKRVLGLRVRSVEGGRVPVVDAVARGLLCAVVVGPVGLAWAVVSRRRAAVHDLLCGTAVVYDWASRPLA